MGMGGGNQTSTTKTELPPELSQKANQYLNALSGLVLPGGQLPAMGSGPQPFQQVAPLTPQQLQAQALISNETYGSSPQGSLGQISQIGQGQAPSNHDLVTQMMGTPYWWNQLQQNPWLLSAFSPNALNQIAQIYT